MNLGTHAAEAALTLADFERHTPTELLGLTAPDGRNVHYHLFNAQAALEAQSNANTFTRPIWHFVIEVFSLSMYVELRVLGGTFGLQPLRKTRGKGFTEYDFGGLYIVTARKSGRAAHG